MAVKFKNAEMQSQLERVTSETKMLFNAFADLAEQMYNKDVVVTDVFRPFDKTVHKWWRGVDVRVNGVWDEDKETVREGQWGADTLTVQEATRIRDIVNANYVYDSLRPAKKAIVFGSNDSENKHWDHVHIQGHPHSRLAVSKMPDISIETNIAEDFEKELPLVMHKASKGDIVLMVAKRVGKAASAMAVAIALHALFPSLSLAECAVIATTYLGAEKAANATVEAKTGKKVDFDFVSLAVRGGQAALQALATRIKNSKQR
jgi:hypothetical protein